MTNLSVTVSVGDALRTINLVDESLGDPADLMRDVLLVMIRSTQLNFESEGRPRWDDLKESTVRRRFASAARGSRKQGSLAIVGSMRILRNAGLLAQSVGLGASGAFASGEGFGDSDSLTAVIGTSQPGWQNQFADTRGWRVAREFFLFQDQDQEDIAGMTADWMMRVGPYAAE